MVCESEVIYTMLFLLLDTFIRIIQNSSVLGQLKIFVL
jgi:hypothetical protein